MELQTRCWHIHLVHLLADVWMDPLPRQKVATKYRCTNGRLGPTLARGGPVNKPPSTGPDQGGLWAEAMAQARALRPFLGRPARKAQLQIKGRAGPSS